LAGGESSRSCKRRMSASSTRQPRTATRDVITRRLCRVEWRLSLLISGQVVGHARRRRRPRKTPLGFSSHPKSASVRARPHFTSPTLHRHDPIHSARNNTFWRFIKTLEVIPANIWIHNPAGIYPVVPDPVPRYNTYSSSTSPPACNMSSEDLSDTLQIQEPPHRDGSQYTTSAPASH
jgi:hypothetical protein